MKLTQASEAIRRYWQKGTISSTRQFVANFTVTQNMNQGRDTTLERENRKTQTKWKTETQRKKKQWTNRAI